MKGIANVTKGTLQKKLANNVLIIIQSTWLKKGNGVTGWVLNLRYWAFSCIYIIFSLSFIWVPENVVALSQIEQMAWTYSYVLSKSFGMMSLPNSTSKNKISVEKKSKLFSKVKNCSNYFVIHLIYIKFSE